MRVHLMCIHAVTWSVRVCVWGRERDPQVFARFWHASGVPRLILLFSGEAPYPLWLALPTQPTIITARGRHTRIGMGNETRYLFGLGAKLVSISSDFNGSARMVLEKLRKHIHLLLLYIHIILQILSHQSCQLFLCAIIFKHLSMMLFCYLQFRSEIALMWRSFSTSNMKALLIMIEEWTNH